MSEDEYKDRVLEMLAAENALVAQLSDLRAKHQQEVRAMEDKAPFECQTCNKGVWKPHKHWSHKRRGKDVYYIAPVTKREEPTP